MIRFRRKTAPKCVVNRVLKASVGTLQLDMPQWFAYCDKKGWRWVKNRQKAHVFLSAEKAELLVHWTTMPSHSHYAIKSI